MEFVTAGNRWNKNFSIFQQWSRRRRHEFHSRLFPAILKVQLQMLGHDKPVQYLDLAVKPCPRSMRGDHVKFAAIRNLPPACAEYLIERSEMPRRSSLGRTISILFTEHQRWSKKHELNRKFLANGWFYDFSRIFHRRIWSLVGNERNVYIRWYLEAYSSLHVNVLYTWDYQTLIRGVCNSPEPDPALTIEVLRTLCKEYDYLKSDVFLLVPSECLETIIGHAKVMQFDFWGMWRGTGNISAILNPVSDFIFQGRNPLATLLLKYGFPHPTVLRTSHTQVTASNSSVVRMFERFIRMDMQYYFGARLLHVRPRLCMYTFMAFDDLDETGDMAKQTLACVMRCVPEPYVLPNEIKDELMPFFNHSHRNQLEEVCRRYQATKLYGEDELLTELKPRALKHLCRCVVRKALADNLRLPEGINELEEPTAIKDFLLLKS